MNATTVGSALLLAIVVQRLLELRLAKRNEAWARAEGAVEHSAGHYPLFFVLHTGWLLAWPAEAWLRGPSLSPGWWGWLIAFGVAQGLRYWAIGSLGRRWNTRILVFHSVARVASGPYRWLPHPNYLAVVIELLAVPMVFGATITAAVVGIANLALLLGIRIPAENRALKSAERSR